MKTADEVTVIEGSVSDTLWDRHTKHVCRIVPYGNKEIDTLAKLYTRVCRCEIPYVLDVEMSDCARDECSLEGVSYLLLCFFSREQ